MNIKIEFEGPTQIMLELTPKYARLEGAEATYELEQSWLRLLSFAALVIFP